MPKSYPWSVRRQVSLRLRSGESVAEVAAETGISPATWARAKHPGAGLTELWLAERGVRALRANGIRIMLKRRKLSVDLPRVHARTVRSRTCPDTPTLRCANSPAARLKG